MMDHDERSYDRLRPLRVLHVVGHLNRGGIETWLVTMLRGFDRQRIATDFLVETADAGDYAAEVLALESRIMNVGAHLSPMYGVRFRRALRKHGPFDVVHSHHHFFNGVVMRLAHQAGVPVRIAHSHTDLTSRMISASLPRKLCAQMMRSWVLRYSTQCIAVSAPAAVSLYGREWEEREQCKIMHCSVDLAPFAEEYDSVVARREFDIPEDAWVVGHVGRMVDVKNHRFIIETFAEINSQTENAYLLLVGDGPLRGDIENLARELGVIHRVRFAGNRQDVPRILCAAIDVFVLPSKYEGLPLALLEAQAAGLPCVVSDSVTTETDEIPEQITRLSIGQSWVDTLLGLRCTQRRRKQSLAQMLRSDFAKEQGIETLQNNYLASGSPQEPRTSLGPRRVA